MEFLTVHANQVADVSSHVLLYPVGDQPKELDNLWDYYRPATKAELGVAAWLNPIITRRAAYSAERRIAGESRVVSDSRLGQLALVEHRSAESDLTVITSAVTVPARGRGKGPFGSFFGRTKDYIVHADVTTQINELREKPGLLNYDDFCKTAISKAIFRVVHVTDLATQPSGAQQT
ncbi:MAG: hypothetical protein ABI602_03430 [Candidatus Saccharibacteria bacterium]